MTKEKLLKRIKQGALLAVAAVMLVTSVGATNVDAAKVKKPGTPSIVYVKDSDYALGNNFYISKVKASGYQVKFSTSKNFKKNAGTLKIKKSEFPKAEKYNGKTCYDLQEWLWPEGAKLKGLKTGKTIYVKVRAYNKKDGKVKFGKWSKVKSYKYIENN